MSSQSHAVGFSQRIRLEWLERTAQARLAGESREAIGEELEQLLHDELSIGGSAVRGSREKTITILLRCWVSVPRRVERLRDSALGLLERLPHGDHLALHWGMCLASYPFFGAVADATGRLLLLQGEVSAAQVQRRLREEIGERATVARAVRRALRTLVDWEVTCDTGVQGFYRQGCTLTVEDEGLAAWLIEAGLGSGGGTPVPLSVVRRWPLLFPFRIAVAISRALGRSEVLELLQFDGRHPAVGIPAVR